MKKRRPLKVKHLSTLLLLLAVACTTASSETVEGGLDYSWWGVEFPTSEEGAAQEAFIRGLTAMHLYMFEDAAAEFRRAQEITPDFAMAYWGEAMTHYRPIWREWEPEAARTILARLAPTVEERAARAPTEREKAYLSAVEALFAEGPPPGPEEPRESHERLRNYERQMYALSQRYPDDVEALALWAGSRVVMFPRTERAMDERMKTTYAAQQVLERNPRHPGAARSHLQSTDDPIHGEIGLLGARVFTGAPEGAKDATAIHLPSHTMAQLGRWREMAEMNWNAFETSMEWTEERGFALSELNNHNYGHLLNYSQYGYLQIGDLGRARDIVDRARTDFEASGEAPVIGSTLASAVALYVVESRDWSWIPTLLELRDEHGMDESRTVHYALGLSGALSGNLDLARASLDELSADPSDPRGTAMHHQVAALITLADGDGETALRLLAETARMDEERLYTHFGTANPMKPAHELYGEVLLELGRPAEALEAFETSLWIFKRRGWSLLGAARAAEEAGRPDLAESYRADLEALWSDADPAVRARLDT